MATLKNYRTCSGRFFFVRIKLRIIICADALTDNALAHRLLPIEAQNTARRQAAMPRETGTLFNNLKTSQQTPVTLPPSGIDDGGRQLSSVGQH